MALFTPIMLASFWTSNGAVRISRFFTAHQLLIQGVVIFIVLLLIPKSWNAWSDRFEKGHQRFLWLVIGIMFLMIPVVAYWCWRFM